MHSFTKTTTTARASENQVASGREVLHVCEKKPPHLDRFPPISNVCAASSLVDTRIGAHVGILTL